MRIHQDWDAPAFGLSPVADHVGPFPDPGFLEAVTSYRPGLRLEVVDDHDGLVALQWQGRTALMAGDASVTDYHSPRGPGASDLVARWWRSQREGTELRWDSLPLQAAEVIQRGLRAAGGSPDTGKTEVTAVLHLPPTFDDYLLLVGKKERHEIRRKMRRYQQHVGDVKLRTHSQPDQGFEEFVRLHRLADGSKGEFMDARTTALFRQLAGLPGWGVDLLEVEGGNASACMFGYRDSDCYYLYNSSFDPAYSAFSPGVVLLAALIEKMIIAGRSRFDFLKGGETYKRRMGAAHRPLYTVRCRR